MLNPQYARDTLARLKADCDFHKLPQETVFELLELAKANKYRAPKNANGSLARMFHAYLMRRAAARETVFYVQGFYGAWEDVTCESSWKEARARLKEYRESEKGVTFRVIKRRELFA